MQKSILSLFIILILCSPNFAQEDIQIGSTKYYSRMTGGYFDYSDPSGINMKVQVWGYVKFPGYYIIPARSNISEIISFAGGPTEDALLDDIRLLRTNLDSTVILYKYNFNSLMWEEQLKNPIQFPKVNAGDIIIVPGEPRYFVREEVRFYISIITALASVTAIILSIIK